jgi:disulfide bond formation protein DsbB
MSSLINRISSNPKLPGLFLFLVCLGALSTAYFVEYVLGIEPCELCLYQRIPYAAVGLFSLFVIVGKSPFWSGHPWPFITLVSKKNGGRRPAAVRNPWI